MYVYRSEHTAVHVFMCLCTCKVMGVHQFEAGCNPNLCEICSVLQGICGVAFIIGSLLAL